MTTQTTYTSTQLSPEADAVFEQGLARARSGFGEHRLLIGEAWRTGRDGTFEERNPARVHEVLGTFASAERQRLWSTMGLGPDNPGRMYVRLRHRALILDQDEV
jgi:hypothetical protein